MVFGQEICDNGVDDDGDGLIDLNDVVDCSCTPITVSGQSLIPNSSFENMACCPSSYTQVNCASGWVQATNATSDYQNTCGFVFGAATNAGLVPFPDGNGILGCIFAPTWQEYVGTCLTTPLVAGTSYSIQLNIASTPIDDYGGVCNGGAINYGPINITLFGALNCGFLPAATVGCPTSPWMELGSVSYTPTSSWGPITITFTPTANIAAVMIGSPCTLPGDYTYGPCYPYFYFDNMLLNTTASFSPIVQSGSYCNHTLQITATPINGASYQWFLDGIAIFGQTSLVLNVSTQGLPTGEYSLVATVGPNCSIATTTVVADGVIAPEITLAGPFCANDAPVDLGADITGGTWSGSGITDANAGTFDPFTANSGNNIITYSLGGICPISSDTTLIVYPLPVSNAGADDDFCIGSNVTLFGSGGTFYLWTPNTGLNIDNIPNPTADPATTTTYTLTVTDANGCQDTDDVIVTVDPLPSPLFDANSECFGTAVQFNDQTTITSGTITQWDWDFDDGNTSTSQDPSHNYAAVGVYNVTLVVTSNKGCTSTTTPQVNVYEIPVADFSSTSVCAATVTDLTDLTVINSGFIASWDWNFGDGTAHSSNINPQHIYATGGTYNVTLNVESDFGCSHSITQPVTVYHVPVAALTATSACLGDICTFTDNSTIASGNITGWNWSFGNGIFSSSQDTIYLYPAAGTYTVGIEVTSDSGCTDTETETADVYDLPIANFSFTDVCKNVAAVLVDESTIPSGNITQWQWDFGDGTPVASGAAPPAHTYPDWGPFDIQLIVTSEGSCKDTSVQTIGIYPVPMPDFSATVVCMGNPTIFTDQSDVEFGSVESWTYNFDDNGVITNNSNPLYTFSTYGTFDVNLTAASDFGCQEDTVITVRVHPVPTANFSATSVCLNIVTSFTDESTIPQGTIVSWDWNFNDGATSTLQNAFHTYPNAGIFNVNLTVTSDSGCSAEVIIPVEVFPLPDVDFTSDIVEGCQPLPINFTDLSVISQSYSIVWWLWSFGDGNTSSAQNPYYIYDTAGVFDVTLQAKTSNGCSVTYTIPGMITVYPKPMAAFTADPQRAEIIYPLIEFTDLSSGAIQWQYDFGDSTNSPLRFPAHTYSDTGTFIVQQIVSTEFGCKDTAYFIIYIDPSFTFYIPNTFTPNGDGKNDFFFGTGIGITGYEMRIFNRWGEEVFASFDKNEKWNGIISKSNELATQDVYVYAFRITDLYGNLHTYRGKLTVLSGQPR